MIGAMESNRLFLHYFILLIPSFSLITAMAVRRDDRNAAHKIIFIPLAIAVVLTANASSCLYNRFTDQEIYEISALDIENSPPLNSAGIGKNHFLN